MFIWSNSSETKLYNIHLLLFCFTTAVWTNCAYWFENSSKASWLCFCRGKFDLFWVPFLCCLEVFFFFFSFSFKSSFLITVWRGSWCWRCDSRARWLWFWWASPTGWFHCCGTYFWSQLIDLVKLTCEFQSLRLSLRMVGVGTLHLQTIIAVVVVGVPVVECPGAQNTEVDKSFHMWISECNISVMISKFRQILSHFVSSSSYDNWPASFCFVARS